MATFAVILVFPIFFQLNGKIFNDPSLVFESVGQLSRLPIPISVFACFGGLFLIRDLKNSKKSIYMLFLTFLFMLGTALISAQRPFSNLRDKLILMVQFLLPMLALILGQVFESEQMNSKLFEKTAIFVLLILVPCQLISTWLSGLPVLSPYLYAFSIYQQLQYVPGIFVCLYLLALYSLWDTGYYKMILFIFASLIGAYAVFSTSILTNVLLYSGIFLFAGLRFYRTHHTLPLLLTLVVICTSVGTLHIMRKDSTVHIQYLQKIDIPSSNPVIIDNKILSHNVPHSSHRMKIWKHFINEIVSNPKMFFFGSPKRPDRNEYASAHNYYLDLAYNFGILSLLPIIGMLILTIKKVFSSRKEVFSDSFMLGLVFVTFFILLIDNSLKVGLRQPYPGIISFFLWGFLLSRLSLRKAGESV